jgi:hypothetical protein
MLQLIGQKEADESGMPGDDVNRAVTKTIRIFKYNNVRKQHYLNLN